VVKLASSGIEWACRDSIRRSLKLGPQLFCQFTDFMPPFDPNSSPTTAVKIQAKKTSVSGVKITGASSALGSNFLANEDLAKLGYDSDWIIQRTGIKSRYHVNEQEATSDLAIRSAQKCLADTNVSPEDVDLIIVATMTPDHLCPSTACLVQAALGCSAAAAIDVNAACSGFMYALVMASQFVKTGCSRNALVIGAEALSVIIDPEDKKTFPLFGDGAGAVLLSPDSNTDPATASGILAYRLASEGEQAQALIVPACGSRMPPTHEAIDQRQQYLKMDGRGVFKWAVRLLPEIVNENLAMAGKTLDDIDLLIPHQANTRIIDAAMETLGLPTDKVLMNLDRYGNTSAASIPLGIVDALEQGRIKQGDNVMMLGFGGGLTWGSCLFRW